MYIKPANVDFTDQWFSVWELRPFPRGCGINPRDHKMINRGGEQ